MTFAPRTWVVGEVVSAAIMNQEIRDQFNSAFDVWTSYTPAWTGATTNPVLGNGAITGRYMKIGRTCHLQIDLVMGATTTYGSGAWSLSVPFAAAATGFRVLGAHAFQSARVAGQMVIAASGTTGLLYFPASTSVSFLSAGTAVVPVTWASTGQLRITGTYETAT